MTRVGHTRTPRPVRLQMSTIGMSVLEVGVVGVRRRDDEQVGSCEHVVEGQEPVVDDVRVGAEDLARP